MLLVSYYAVATLFIILCLVLIFVVLIQKGRGGGISGAFGGSGGNTAFGSKTGDVLTWATSIIFGLFMLLAVTLNLIADKMSQPTTPTQAATPASPVGLPPAPTPTPSPTNTPTP
jgi:preprotein translocase subunit SecG